MAPCFLLEITMEEEEPCAVLQSPGSLAGPGPAQPLLVLLSLLLDWTNIKPQVSFLTNRWVTCLALPSPKVSMAEVSEEPL